MMRSFSFSDAHQEFGRQTKSPASCEAVRGGFDFFNRASGLKAEGTVLHYRLPCSAMLNNS
jgi:hypothetical protein